MNKAEIKVVRFENSDVIATSGFFTSLTKDHKYEFTGFTDTVAGNAGLTDLSDGNKTATFSSLNGYNWNTITAEYKSGNSMKIQDGLSADAKGNAVSGTSDWSGTYIWNGSKFVSHNQ